MAIPVVASFTENSSIGSASLALTKPASVVAGNLLVILAASDDATSIPQFTHQSVAGFHHFYHGGDSSTDIHIAAFYRVADGTEGASFTVNAQSSDDFTCWCLRITGANRWNPIDVVGYGVSGSAASEVIDSITTTVNDCLAFYLFAYDGGDNGTWTTTGTGWSSSDVNTTATGSGNLQAGWGTKSQATAGATGAVTVTGGAALIDGTHGFQFAIAPAAPTHKIDGITKDKDGVALGSCDVYCFKNIGNDSFRFIGYQVSNATTGAYSFANLEDNNAQYLVISRKAGAPNVFDVTDFVLTPVVI